MEVICLSATKGTPTAYTVPAAIMHYRNIIFQNRRVHDGDVFSRKHPKMSQLNRTKIFAPFAALVGFDERVHRKEVVYVSKHELDADDEWALNQKLFDLHRLTANTNLARLNMVCVSIEYFVVCTDEENGAYQVKGQYKTITGIVLKVDQHAQHSAIQCGTDTLVIPFSEIYRIFDPAG